MSITNLLRTACTVTRVTHSGTGGFGDPAQTTTTATTVCHIQQRRAFDTTVGQWVATEEWQAWLPADTAIDSNDTVTVDGVTYQVYGPPAVWSDAPAAAAHHVEVNLRRTS